MVQTIRDRTLSALLAPSFPLFLKKYFSSGWAFLIPYLLTYLLYAWRKWPANPASGVVKVSSENESVSALLAAPPTPSLPHYLTPPPLLYIYWALHAIHVALAAVALRSWWRAATQPQSSINSPPVTGSLSTTDRPPSTAHRKALRAVAPWALLALIFYIPGVYLEWPSDPWEHLRRITEWATHPVVANHSAGYKSFYFFAYSWVGWLSPVHLLSWLNVYYVGVCLLLALQYYLLAKTVGLDRRWAFLSVIVNVLTFGNVCFSFYRYYALASTIFAQIGAVALTRIVLVWAQDKGQKAQNSFVSNDAPTAWQRLRAVAPLWAGRLALCASLFTLIASNHIQGIGIAGLGIAAVIIWRLIEWKRSMIFSLGAAVIVLSAATLLWWPHAAGLDSLRGSHGALTFYYGFNFFDLRSVTTVHLFRVVGTFGLVNLICGLWLCARNQPIGWLTIAPTLLLALPCTALPIADTITRSGMGPSYIFTYYRLLFAIPACLAFVTICQKATNHLSHKQTVHIREKSMRSYVPHFSTFVTLLFAIGIPPGSPSYNRFWNLVSKIPDDLQLRTPSTGVFASLATIGKTDILIPGFTLQATIAHAGHPILTNWHTGNLGDMNYVGDTERVVAYLSRRAPEAKLILFSPQTLTSPYSYSSLFAKHWTPQITAMNFIAYDELKKISLRRGSIVKPIQSGAIYLFPK